MLDESVLIVGGFDGSSLLSIMTCWYPSSDIMGSLPAMRSVHSHVSTAKLKIVKFMFLVVLMEK